MPLHSTAAERFVLGNHDLNPPVQECCPTLGQKARADGAKVLPHEFSNPANPERVGKKGSKMET